MLIIALLVALIIKTFVVQEFFIPSGSMENTLLIGDKILVNKLVYHVRSIAPGDIVVVNGEGSWDPSPPPARPSGNPVARASLDRATLAGARIRPESSYVPLAGGLVCAVPLTWLQRRVHRRRRRRGVRV